MIPERGRLLLPGRGGTRSRAIAVGALAMAFSAPGQTAAISIFVDPIAADLGLSRSTVSAAYLVGTLAGALAMPLVGRLIDRFGVRRLLVAVALGFAGVLLASSVMSGIVGLTAAFVGVRVAGQGALTLLATMTVALHVHRRRGTATGVAFAIGTAGISLAPVLLERLVAAGDWRAVWFGEGVAVALVLVPAILVLLPRRPASAADGDRDAAAPAPGDDPDTAGERAAVRDRTLGEAARTGMFWVVVGGVGVCGLIATGLSFWQLSLLGERGLSAAAAAATFVPQTAAGLVASFGLGWLADRCSDRVLMVATMTTLAAATLLAGVVEPGWTVVLYGVLLGACSNGIRTLEAIAFPRLFGLAHLGAIRGVVHAVAVGGSALGPFLLALGREQAGTYRPSLYVLTALPVAVAVAAFLVRGAPRPSRGG